MVRSCSVYRQPYFSAGDKRIGALWDPKEQVKQRRKEGKKARDLQERKKSTSDLRKRDSNSKLPSSSGEVVIWERAEDGSMYIVDDASLTTSAGSDRSGSFIPSLNFKPRPRSYTYAQENARIAAPPSPLHGLRRIGSTPQTGGEEASPQTSQQSKISTSTSNSQSTSPRVSDLESPSHYGRKGVTRNNSLGDESEETAGDDGTGTEDSRSSLIAVGARGTPRAQHKQRLWEELKREKERIARIKAELEKMEEQKEEKPVRVTQRQMRLAESVQEALLDIEELVIEEPEPSPGLKEGEKEFRKVPPRHESPPSPHA